MTTIDLNDPIALLLAAADALERASISAAAYGGLALAIYGEPRETRDADLAVLGASAEAARDALAAVGLTASVAFDHVGFGGLSISRISVVGGGELNTVDLVEPRSARYAGLVLARALTGTLRDRQIRVVSPEDFVVLKVLSTRDRDLEDAATVIRGLGASLDLEWIDGEIATLSDELSHDVTGRWSKVRGR